MKIAIISYVDLVDLPYINKYYDILKKTSVDYDVYLWNRSDKYIPEYDKKKYIVYNKKISENKISNVIDFISWRRFVLSMLKRTNYDKLVLLTTQPGILLFSYVLRNYKGNYIYDFRDYTYEKNKLYYLLVKKMIENSALTLISSCGFLEFLPKSNKIVMNHNITNLNKANYKIEVDYKIEMINFGFLGGVRYFSENKRMIDKLSGILDIKFYYIGRIHSGANFRQQYSDNRQVNFKGEYLNKDKYKIYKENKINLINSVYGNTTLEVTTALPNKLYDCVIFKIPIVVSKGTYLEKIVKEYNLGFSIDVNTSDFVDDFIDYINSFDRHKFQCGCEKYLRNCMIEDENATRIIKETLFCDKKSNGLL